MAGFIDKVTVLRQSLRELEAERNRLISEASPSDVRQMSIMLQNLAREILEHRVEIVSMGGDPDKD